VERMDSMGVQKRIESLKRAMEARHDVREYRSGAIKFGDAVADLAAYLEAEAKKARKE